MLRGKTNWPRLCAEEMRHLVQQALGAEAAPHVEQNTRGGVPLAEQALRIVTRQAPMLQRKAFNK